MKLAVIGSRKISSVDMDKYISDTDEIVSGGAVGIDSCAAEYAKRKGLKLTVFLPQYDIYGRAAPIVRNKKINIRRGDLRSPAGEHSSPLPCSEN